MHNLDEVKIRYVYVFTTKHAGKKQSQKKITRMKMLATLDKATPQRIESGLNLPAALPCNVWVSSVVVSVVLSVR